MAGLGPLNPTATDDWAIAPDGIEFVRYAADDWARAAVADGDEPGPAHEAAERTITLYTVPPRVPEPAGRVDRSFAALGDPVRRAILRLLAEGEQPVGGVVEALAAVRPISQPAVSQHLTVLRGAGLVTMRAEGNRRLYALDATGITAVRAWLDAQTEPVATFAQPLDALATEIARGRRRPGRLLVAEPLTPHGDRVSMEWWRVRPL